MGPKPGGLMGDLYEEQSRIGPPDLSHYSPPWKTSDSTCPPRAETGALLLAEIESQDHSGH